MRGVSDRSARRLREVVERDERRPHNVVERPNGGGQFNNNLYAQITSTTLTDGRYPGTLYARIQDAATASFELEQGESAGGIWVDTPNGETLTTGVYYPVRPSGTKPSDGKPIFDVIGKISAGAAFSGARVYQSTASSQTLTHNTPANMTFDTQAFDTDSYWAIGSPANLVIPSDGYYFVSAWAYFDTNGTGVRDLKLSLNSVGTFAAATIPGSASRWMAVCVSGLVEADEGNIVTVIAFQNSGGNLSMAQSFSSPHTGASIHRVG